MRILAISDHFPPHNVGGYELACADAMAFLKSRGHQVHVLTSDFRIPGVACSETVSYPVDRSLQYHPNIRPKPYDKPWPLWYRSVFFEAAPRERSRGPSASSGPI